MNRILLSLVSYFICLLFFTAQAHAATYNVNDSNPGSVGSGNNGTLSYVLGLVNGAGSGAGPHVINITVKGTTYYGATLSKDNVTITGGSCTPNTNTILDLAGGPLNISGNGCIIKGLLLQGTALNITGSNNQVYGCWFNLNTVGTAGQGSVSNACINIQSGAINTIIGSKTCQNYFSGTGVGGSSVIALDNTCTGTVISNNFIGYAANGTTILGAAANSIRFLSSAVATGSRIDSNTIVSNSSDIILIEGDFSSSFIRKNTIQKSTGGSGINGLSTSIFSNTIISGNTINSNGGYGMLIQGTTANGLQITNNNIGATTAGLAGTSLGNVGAGIKVASNSNSLTISGNVVLDNGFPVTFADQANSSGIFVHALGKTMSNVTVSNNRAGIDVNDTKKGNSFSGIYLQVESGGSMSNIIVSGNIVGDNGSNPNGLAYNGTSQKSHGISFRDIGSASVTNAQIINNYIGVTPVTDPTPNANVGNYGNGLELNNTSGFTVTGNVIGFNKFATMRDDWAGGAIMINGGSSLGIVRGNYIGETAAGVNIGNTNPGNTKYTNQMAGITVQASTNITIGGTSAGQANVIKNNNWGVQLANSGSTLASNVKILGNTISNQTAYGIYIPGGNGNNIGDGTAAGANIITANGLSGTYDGIYILNSTSLNNKISRNQIFCNTGQGIKLNYGANQGNNGQAAPVITGTSGTTVTGTASAAATIEVFSDNDPSCPTLACGTSVSDNRREGKTYLGTTTADGSGNWSYTNALIDANNVSATATVGANTSEFSYCSPLTICPITQITTSGPISICSTTTTVNLSALDQSSMAGVTQGWSSPNLTVTYSPSSSSNNVTVGNLPIGTTTFTWLVKKAGCADDPKTINVTVVAPSTLTANVNTTSVCNTNATVTLTGTPVTPGNWSISGGTATFTNQTNGNSNATITSGTNVIFTWNYTGTCPDTKAAPAVTVVAPSTLTANVNTTSVCNTNATVTLTGTPVTPGNWSISGGTATFTNQTNGNSNATITSGTNVIFTWNYTGTCPDTKAAPAVTVVAPSTLTANVNTTSVCNTNATVTLTGTPVTPGNWSISGGTATFTNQTNGNSNATITSGTNVIFTWNYTGTCPDTKAAPAVTVVAPSTLTANVNTTSVCNTNATVTLTGTPVTPGNWSISGGTATFTNQTNGNSNATITSGTNVIFTWNYTGTCPDTKAAPAVTVVAPSTLTANVNTTSVCNTNATVTLTGTPVTPGNWSISGGTATFTNQTNGNSNATITSGTNVIFTWNYTGTCPDTKAAPAVTVVAPSTLTANVNTTSVCNTNATVTLTGTPVTPGNWSISGGTATFTNQTNGNSNATITSGTNVIFTWNYTGTCPDTKAAPAVTVVAPSTLTANVNTTSVCNTNATVTLTGTPVTPGNWSISGGTATFTNQTNGNSNATITSGTNVIFTWNYTGTCPDTKAAPTVTVVAPGSVSANANKTAVCSNDGKITLTGSPSPGTWSVLTGTGAATFEANDNTKTPNNAVITSGTAIRFIWTVSNGACNGADTTTAITVNTPVQAVIIPDPVNVCGATTAVVNGNNPAPATGAWSKLSGSGNIVSGQTASPTANVENLTVGGTSQFVWTVTSPNLACVTKDTVDVISVDQGAPADAGADTLYVCNDNKRVLQAVGSGSWSIPSPSTNPTVATFSPDAIHANTTVTGLTTGTYSFVWTIASVIGCPSLSTTTDTVKVIVRTVTAPDIDGDTTAVCLTKDYNYNVTNFNALNNYLWTTSTSNLAIQGANNASAVVVRANGGGRVTVTATAPGRGPACAVASFIDLNLLPSLPIGDTTRLATCIFNNYTINTNVFDTTYFDGTWSSTNGAVTFTYHPQDSTTTINGLVDGTNVTLTYTVSSLCGHADFVYILKVGGYFTNLEASGPSDTLCVSQARNLNALVSPTGNYTYYWVSNLDYNNPVMNSSAHIDSTTVPTYSVTPHGPNNVYFVYVVDKASQCKTNIDTAYIHAVEGQDLNVPNLITPNDDNMNDHWVLKDKTTGKDILPGSHFELYNRWGQRVFVMDNYDNRFKGDHISDGVYFFNVKSGCGDKEYKGWLQILANTNP